MKLLLLSLLVAVTLTGCAPDYDVPQQTPHAKQPILMVERDGVKLWRVYDTDRATEVYFTTPTGDTQWDHQVGKSTVTENVSGRQQ